MIGARGQPEASAGGTRASEKLDAGTPEKGDSTGGAPGWQGNLPRAEEVRSLDGVIRKTRDPVAWKEAKKKKEAESATASEVSQDTRSRIAL